MTSGHGPADGLATSPASPWAPKLPFRLFNSFRSVSYAARRSTSESGRTFPGMGVRCPDTEPRR